MGQIFVNTNTISNQTGQREATERAVRDVLAERTGEWIISLIERNDDDASPGWIITIEGSEGTRQTWTFDHERQESAIVKATLERDLGHTMLPMGWRSEA